MLDFSASLFFLQYFHFISSLAPIMHLRHFGEARFNRSAGWLGVFFIKCIFMGLYQVTNLS